SSATAATSAASASAAAAAKAASAACTIFTRAGFIDRQGASAHLGPVKLRDGFIGVIVAHLDKAEALRPAAVTIRNDIDRFDRPHLLEQRGQVVLRRLIRQISNIDSFAHDSPNQLRGTSDFAGRR